MDPEICAESSVHISHSFVLPHQTQSSIGLAEHPSLDPPTQQGCLLLHLEASILEKHHETKKVWEKVFWGSFCSVKYRRDRHLSRTRLFANYRKKSWVEGKKKNQTKTNNPLRQAIFSINDKQHNYSQTKLKATGKKREAQAQFFLLPEKWRQKPVSSCSSLLFHAAFLPYFRSSGNKDKRSTGEQSLNLTLAKTGRGNKGQSGSGWTTYSNYCQTFLHFLP